MSLRRYMRQANKTIKQKRHLTSTIKEIIGYVYLNGTTFFSILNLNRGLQSAGDHPKSRYITTFSTHLGLMRYKRLNAIHESMEGIDGVIKFVDDILVYGKIQEEHN